MQTRLAILLLLSPPLFYSDPRMASAQISVEQTEGRITILRGSQEFATYVFRDPEIQRPYFANIKFAGGRQVTRNHPPIEGVDRKDHATMHPGIWLAFGDLAGQDFWRNKAIVQHEKFLVAPASDGKEFGFIERKNYLGPNSDVICNEEFRCKLVDQPDGVLLLWDSTFNSSSTFAFGDQEEMGLGIRIATPLTQQNGGKLTDSEGRVGAKAIWSNVARWCDYSGRLDDEPVGITLMSHPENFRASWHHARDYGLIVANPFGRNAMKKGPMSQIKIEPEGSLRLRFAVWIHAGTGGSLTRINSVYDQFQELSK